MDTRKPDLLFQLVFDLIHLIYLRLTVELVLYMESFQFLGHCSDLNHLSVVFDDEFGVGGLDVLVLVFELINLALGDQCLGQNVVIHVLHLRLVHGQSLNLELPRLELVIQLRYDVVGLEKPLVCLL